MQLILRVWSDFLALKWWEKLIVLIPVIVLIILSFLFGRWITSKKQQPSLNKDLIEQNRELIDQQVDDWIEIRDKERARRQELQIKRTAIQEQMEKKREDNEQIIKSIDDANSVDELLAITEELRRKHRSRARSNKTSGTGTRPWPATTTREDDDTQW